MKLVEEELCCDLNLIDMPLFTTCPLFKKRVNEVAVTLIHSQAKKTVDLVQQLLSMELNFINVRHPDFIGRNMEQVRVDAQRVVREVGIGGGCDPATGGEED